MADARWSFPGPGVAAEVLPKVCSVMVHPTRESAALDADGFHQVHSRRRWRRRLPTRLLKPLPEDLIGLCFNCLGDDHVKADYRFPSCCRSCRREGHHARNCPFGSAFARAKRGRSPARSGSGRGVPHPRALPARWREETVLARSVSTSRTPSVPHYCAPPSPEAVEEPARPTPPNTGGPSAAMQPMGTQSRPGPRPGPTRD